jgi:hypothetical protein
VWIDGEQARSMVMVPVRACSIQSHVGWGGSAGVDARTYRASCSAAKGGADFLFPCVLIEGIGESILK